MILGDVPIGADADTARAAIRLVLLYSVPGGDDAAAATFSPVAVTPDELGAAWEAGRLIGAPTVDLNGRPAARPEAADAAPRLSAADRPGGADARAGGGSILAAGTVAGPAGGLGFGDVLRVEMRDALGHSIFGAIEQTVEPLAVPA